MVGIAEKDSDFILSVCVFEQDLNGNVVKRYELRTIENDASIETPRQFSQIQITENGDRKIVALNDGTVKDKMLETRNSVISALKRGKNTT